ncbi:tyrosine-type recombinase/integrase [Flintibacter muris]|uniref:tyrosine-type recombinase/integrase n=1 Tax=Flintibacter muris TaxID=2941327 RepID=UPI00203E342F|nr:site-specific integrase [Flintibacter muris]
MAKRRPSGDGMVRKRDDGRWEGRIVVGHKENGVSIFRYVYAPTQKELSAKLRQHIDSYQGADLTEQSRMTLSEWLNQWLENMADTLRPNTLRNYRSYIENHIRPGLGNKQLSRITPKDVQRFYEKLSDCLASGTVRRIHTTLHGALKAAQQAHLIASNPTEQIIAPKFSYRAKQVLTDEQLDVFMRVIAEDEIWCDFFYTELTTGLRRGEICGLKWEDFDEVAGTLKVCRTVYRQAGGELTAGDTKTNAGTRKILLPASTAAVLSERKESALSEWIFPNLLKPEQPTDPGSAYRQLKVLLKRAGLPNIRFHDLRHTFATHALASGVDVKTLSSILGHTRAAFTLDTYTHTTGDMQKRASEVVGDFLTDIFGEELRPWEENAKAARVQSG